MLKSVLPIMICALGLSLGTTSAVAQSGAFIDMLAAGSGGVVPLRSFDPATRASNRLAIVIGNSDYAAVPDLPNALADADVIASFLRAQGYIVSQHANVTKRDFEDILRRVLFDADADTEVVVFYAGHGFQIGSENYLVPVDADFDTIYDVPFESVSLGSMVGIIGARARMTIVMLDACRDNPFAGRQALTNIGNDLRETRTGFTSQPAPLNSMLVYSTAPGSVAFDGEGTNSPFTASFIEEVSATPDAQVQDIFEGVRLSVYERTEGRQVPWDSSTLIEPASFGLGAALLRPIAVDSTGIGENRGLARLGDDTVSELETVTPAALEQITIAADFAEQVAIGDTLLAALGDAPTVRVLTGPALGHMTLTTADDITRDVVGQDLTPAEVAGLVLLNRSVQMPALGMGDSPMITDAFTLQAGDRTLNVALELTPNPCDFEAGDHLDPDGMGITRYPNEIQPEQALAACQAAIAAEPQTGRFHYQLGRALLALRRNDEARAAFETARDLGHVRAWHALGMWIANQDRLTGGQATVALSEEAQQFLARGAVEGDPYPMFTLGANLMRNGETEAIQIEGYDLVMRSLEVGHTFAMNGMAQLYLDEEGEFYDPARGLRYLTESAARGDIYGYNGLGLVYWRGRADQPQDFARAFDLFTQAAAGGHPTAPFNLGRMLRDGDAPGGVDMDAAVAQFLTALERGHAGSAAQAAYLIRTEQVAGYDGFDAAAIAARGAVLLNASGADDAREQLDAMSDQELTGGLQRLLAGLGAEVTVDGAYGPGTAAAMALVGADPAGGPTDRILSVAAVYWQRSPFRVDLY
jgi:TPR repeat protein